MSSSVIQSCVSQSSESRPMLACERTLVFLETGFKKKCPHPEDTHPFAIHVDLA